MAVDTPEPLRGGQLKRVNLAIERLAKIYGRLASQDAHAWGLRIRAPPHYLCDRMV